MAEVSSTEANGGGDVVTWHHGLMARWWANFNLDGPEIDYFRRFVEAGQPALDAACGTGRLLVPWVAAGLEVDGVDASADMIACCREAGERVGRSPALYVQPLHGLDLPRRYGSIVVCGGFGLGATRAQDVEGLRRLFAHLEPGGLLALDYGSTSSTPSAGGGGSRARPTRRRPRPPIVASPPTASSTRSGTASSPSTGTRDR